MNWNWTDHYDEEEADDPVLDQVNQLARKLAAAAGFDWDRMNHHPGFERERWREAARRAMAG